LLITASTLAGEVGGSIGATSDYVYRGISQTNGNPALQADLHYRTPSGWSVGTWASTADLDAQEGAGLEVDIYAGRHWTISPDWDARLGLTHYFYARDQRPLRYDYNEVIATLGYRSRVFATIAWSPDVSRYANGTAVKHQAATSYELTATQPLIGQLSASMGAGYYDLPTQLAADYWFWNAGLSCSIGRAQLIVSYIDTDHTAASAFGYEVSGSRWVGSLAWTF
jgi:uncharacterized protein (TIGR02001 family)